MTGKKAKKTISHALPVVLLAVFLTAAACAPAVKLQPISSMQQAHAVPVLASEYRIQPGDKLSVEFPYNPDLDEQVPVRPDGRISLQMIPEVMAAGLTPSALTDQLTKDYSAKLAKPQLTVIVRSFGGHMIFVDGEVNKPGMLTMAAPMTVLDSLSEAGGVKDTANRKQIIIIRRGPGNKPVALSLNMEKVIYGKTADPGLLPGDIVYVPKSSIANVNMWVDQYIRKNIPINADAGVFYNLEYNHYHN